MLASCFYAYPELRVILAQECHLGITFEMLQAFVFLCVTNEPCGRRDCIKAGFYSPTTAAFVVHLSADFENHGRPPRDIETGADWRK
jgi:hypothetical protein